MHHHSTKKPATTLLKNGENIEIPPNHYLKVRKFGGYTVYFQTFPEFALMQKVNRLQRSARDCLDALCCRMYDQNIVVVDLNELQEQLGVSTATMHNIFAELKAANLLRKGKRRTYYLNPYLYWRGDQEREEQRDLSQARTEWDSYASTK